MAAASDYAPLVLDIIRDVARAKGLDCGDLSLESPVDRRLGLDSLDWAAVVVRLEMETGIDPFAAGTAGTLSSVADLVDLYNKAAG